MKERAQLAVTAPLPYPKHSRLATKMTSSSTRFCHSDTDDSDDVPHSSASSRGTFKHAHTHRLDATSPSRPRSIAQKRQQKQFKIEMLDAASTVDEKHRLQHETPEGWFQRVMKAKQLSPLDLCDLFSYGDARRHPVVPLSHVCEVLYDLDPEVAASGHDPVTPEMEEFLYHFSFEDVGDQNDSVDGEGEKIVVNVKDALRSLDIWQSIITSPPKSKPATKSSNGTFAQQNSPIQSVSPTKSAALVAKNKQLQATISNLKATNLRLSQQLDEAMQLRKSATQIAPPSTSDQYAKGKALLSSMSSLSSTILGSSISTSPVTRAKSHPVSAIINQHEDTLVKIANRLQYSGVKQLEELLLQCDTSLNESASSTTTSNPANLSGFVTLKQLRWLLSEHFQVDITETELMESCLGMNFNAQAQVDYRELVHVLLDVLVYAFPTASTSRKQQLHQRIREYIASGFNAFESSTDETKRNKIHREMLARLCEKYDLEGSQLISVAEIMRVFYKDLPKLHTLHMAFPLTQQDALRVVQPFARELTTERSRAKADSTGANKSKSGNLSYPKLLDVLFADPGSEDSGAGGTETCTPDTHPVLEWAFWTKLRKMLCDDNPALEPKIHAQLCKIFKKLDPAPRRFLVSKRIFTRILDQHLGSDELAALRTALIHPISSKEHAKSKVDEHQQRHQQAAAPTSDLLRFDVFMKLVFGAPALQDTSFLSHNIVSKLKQNEVPIRTCITELLKKHGGGWEITPGALYSLLTCNKPATDKMVETGQTKQPTKSTPTEELTITEVMYLFAVLDDDHEGLVKLTSLWTFLKDECWSGANSSRRNGDNRTTRRGSVTLESTRRMIARCMDAYDLERALSSYKMEQSGGRISQDQLLKEIYRMLSSLGYDAHNCDELDPASLQQLISAIAVQTNDADLDLVRTGRLHLPIAVDAFFDALFDWCAMVSDMGLPHNLVEVKRTLELFDWNKDGSVALQDWSKAWRVICPNNRRDLAEWELRVLQRRFSAGSGRRGHRSREQHDGVGIDYARLLVHLMDMQHQHARQRLKKAVVAHFRQICSRMCGRRTGGGRLTVQEVETLFRRIDSTNKGHINLRDLQTYLTNELFGEAKRVQGGCGAKQRLHDTYDDDAHLVQNVNAVAFVLDFLAGNHITDDVNETHQREKSATVSRSRFHEFLLTLTDLSMPMRRAGFTPRDAEPNGSRQSQVIGRSCCRSPTASRR